MSYSSGQLTDSIASTEGYSRPLPGKLARAELVRDERLRSECPEMPYVWSGRAQQEDFGELMTNGLASMYPGLCLEHRAPGHYGYQRGCDLISGQTSRLGHLGHQCTQSPGRPNLHLVSSSRRPRRMS